MGNFGEPDRTVDYDRGKITGFSLLEVVIALAIGSLIAVAIYEFFGSQNRSYLRQDEAAEMQQNLRVALEKISRDLTMAGFGKPMWSEVNGRDLSAWYNEHSSYPPVRGGTTLDIIGCDSVSNGTVSLMELDSDSARITLKQPASTVAENFDISKRSDISVGGRENTKIIKIEGSILTVKPKPSRVYAAGTEVFAVRHLTYSTGISDDVPVLFVDDYLGAHRQALCQFVTGLQAVVHDNTVTVRLDGQTRNPDRSTGKHLTSSMTAVANIRNP